MNQANMNFSYVFQDEKSEYQFNAPHYCYWVEEILRTNNNDFFLASSAINEKVVNIQILHPAIWKHKSDEKYVDPTQVFEDFRALLSVELMNQCMRKSGYTYVQDIIIAKNNVFVISTTQRKNIREIERNFWNVFKGLSLNK